MDKLKEKLSRLMYGRYGIDQLGNFMMWAAASTPTPTAAGRACPSPANRPEIGRAHV